jgi:phosphate transport system substrate-binding protein
VALPALPIVPVHLAESSGATYTLSDYLSTVSPAWAHTLGRGKLLSWPVGIAAAHSDGMIAATQDHMGAIGYADLYAVVNAALPFMAVRNASNVFVAPLRSAVLVAADQFPQVSALHYSIVDAPGPRSYPISGYTWVMIRARHANTAHGAALIQLFRWMSTTAQGYAALLNYVPLPLAVQQVSAQTLDLVSVGR